MFYVGLDIHTKRIAFCVLSDQGQLVQRGQRAEKRGEPFRHRRVDRKSGGLAFTGHYVPVGNPSSIAFLDRKKRD